MLRFCWRGAPLPIQYEGNPNQWNALKILRAYFYSPKTLGASDELFLRELDDATIRIRFRNLAEIVGATIETARSLVGCFYHPGRPSAVVRFGKNYCQKCIDGINTSVATVDAHVVPKDCFVVYKGSDTWEPITGTGCAHWVAHERAIGRGTEKCLDNKTLRVPELIDGTATVPRASVAINEIWASSARDHCGLVINVVPQSGSPSNKITIRHDSSRQGGLKDSDFDSYFHADGTFHR